MGLTENRQIAEATFLGAAIGDALGVPYEFHNAEEIPPYDEIEMTPPKGFDRSHPSTALGTWSDDGAQALCLLNSLLKKNTLDLEDFASSMLDWYENGYMAVGGKVFDIGIQISSALMAYKSGTSPEKSGMVNPNGKGNGALMRVLPLVLWHKGGDEELVAHHFGGAVEVDGIDGLVRGKGDHPFHLMIQHRVDHVFRAVHIGANRFGGIVFTGRHLL